MTIKRTLFPPAHLRQRPQLKHEESDLQIACVRWFRLQYPQYARLLFAVPNGGNRNLREAARMKAEGVTAGVADLILLMPSHEYGALCIELKTVKGRQSNSQKEWQEAAEKAGNRYVICRTFDQFRKEVSGYLK